MKTRIPMANAAATVNTVDAGPDACTAVARLRSMAASHDGAADAFPLNWPAMTRGEALEGRALNTALPTHREAQAPRVHRGRRSRGAGSGADLTRTAPGHAARANTA